MPIARAPLYLHYYGLRAYNRAVDYTPALTPQTDLLTRSSNTDLDSMSNFTETFAPISEP